MKILVDTHILLWYMTDDHRLSVKHRQTYVNKQNKLFFSMASLWELAIKSSLNKVNLAKNWFFLIQNHLIENAISLLPITPEHCHQVSLLPFFHRDPFDRLLIAQAKLEELTLLTADPKLKKYDIKIAV